ncbi:MAG: YihY/virulence factor BrkB family protein [Bacteroidetes bacterium]|nr:YihY/virulence factor BrkB family protein [Bacteroidota bacterium]
MKIKNILNLFKLALKEWWAKDPFKESAVIAYYAIFSLPGLLMVILTIAGYFFGQDAVSGRIASQITSTLGPDTAHQVEDIIANGFKSRNSMFATIIGILTILVGATGVFVEFQKSLNSIWGVKRDITKSGFLRLVKERVFSFGLIISVAFILIVSLVISATIAALSSWVVSNFSETVLTILQFVNAVLSLCILAGLFALMFKIIPDAKIKWSHVGLGSIVTALLFELGKFTLGIYFSSADPGSGYGAAGSVILILLWVSYSSMIVFYGAEFTYAYALWKEGKIVPAAYAEKVPAKLNT